MNITEDYVSFEIAKLLKEKGFDEKLQYYYDTDGILVRCRRGQYFSNKSNAFIAPTLQMVMKWLRENKNFNINNKLTIHGYFCSISHIVKDSMGYIIDIEDSEAWETPYYHTYKEACEAAIKYCLENII